jgi:hypothetical protein
MAIGANPLPEFSEVSNFASSDEESNVYVALSAERETVVFLVTFHGKNAIELIELAGGHPEPIINMYV